MIDSVLLLLAAEIMASSSVIFIRLSTMHPMLLSSYRMLLAVLLLMPWYIRETRKPREGSRPFDWKDVKKALIPGILLGIHFISWINGARMIPAANASLLVNLTPMVSPLMLLLIAKERVNLGEITGSLIALGGCVFLAVGDFSTQKEYFLGDIITLSSMLAFALYQTIAKRRMTGLWRYLVPLYLTGGIVCFILGAAVTNPFAPWTIYDLIAVLGLSLICTIGGHSIFNHSMKVLRGQTVSVFHTSQFIYAGIMGYFILNESPGKRLIIAAPILLTGVIITLLSHGKKAQAQTS